MQKQRKFSLLTHAVGVGLAAAFGAAACSSSSAGATCAPPPFLTASSCGKCITTACKTSVDTTCNAGGAFSNCYCSCMSKENSVELCTLSCASSSCQSATV